MSKIKPHTVYKYGIEYIDPRKAVEYLSKHCSNLRQSITNDFVIVEDTSNPIYKAKMETLQIVITALRKIEYDPYVDYPAYKMEGGDETEA